MHIAILTGGISAEREVALRSGTNIMDYVEKSGNTGEIFDFPTELDIFLTKYRTYDLVIPMFHGTYGEDGQVTAFLKTLNCKYAYSDFDVHTLCIDKYKTNLYLENIGIRIPKTLFLRKDEDFSLENTEFPVIVKPNHGGSSLATKKAIEHDELAEACMDIVDDDILIQECIEGREFTVGVYRDTNGYHSLPIIEICTLSGDFFDYAEKYETDGSNEVFIIGENELQKKISEASLRVCEYIETKGVVRLDWRYDDEDMYFLEVNTIPGFTSGSLVPKMWKEAGKSEKEFIEMLSI